MALKLVVFLLFILPATNSALECYRSSPGAGYTFQRRVTCGDGNQCMAWRYETQLVGDSFGARCVEGHVADMCGKRVISTRGNNLVYHVCCCSGELCNTQKMAGNCFNSEDMKI